MYKIIFEKKPLVFFKKLDKILQERIARKIEQLKENPQLGKPLTGNLSGLWSLRIDKYRMIYQIRNEELIILILDLGHRKNVYN
jgi:mRNA interferase RelE/StbE